MYNDTEEWYDNYFPVIYLSLIIPVTGYMHLCVYAFIYFIYAMYVDLHET